MDHLIADNVLRPAGRIEAHPKAITVPLDPAHLGSGVDGHAKRLGRLGQDCGQIGVEVRQNGRTALQHGDRFCPGPR